MKLESRITPPTTVNNLPELWGALVGCTKTAAVETFMFSLHVKLEWYVMMLAK
jgi:hypothetical protein